jgi:uncharacterized repeat protein (TIGR01451 family)
MWQTLSKTMSTVNWYLSILLIIGLLIAPYQSTYTYAQTTDDTMPVETLLETSDEETVEEDPVVLIETGTADAITETYNFSNTNDVQTASTTEPAASSTLDKPTESIAETDTLVEDPEDSTSIKDSAVPETASTTIATTTPPATIVEIENQATSTTAATTSATTGDNSATTSPSGTAIISSGDAYAYTNVVNLTNTNIINSDGFIVFLNQLFGTSDIDFRDMFDVFSDTDTPSDVCTTSNCQAGGLETYISNQTAISNDITVVADTGSNQSTGSTAAVLTGDAYAAANVTNVANTNIVDANYLVMTFSNFGDLFGDVILPGASLLEKLFQASPSVQTDATIINNATIENQVSAIANTGNNTTTGSSSVIETGDATTYTNVYNQTNTNVINSDSFTILFRVHGDWAGEVFGLPEGLSYEHTAAGITISNTTSQSTPAMTNNISATITNDASITNNVSLEANTGSNQAYGNELGYVGTGDAYAAANVTNVANTNILGRNWSLLIFDIFGDWQGDISFGQPDIWIGGTANALNGTTAAGSEILYTFTISNLGDATAKNVVLNGNLSSDLITLEQPMLDLQIGSIAPGETIEKTFVADVTNSLPSGSFPVDLEAELTSSSPDADFDNNSEVVTVIAENRTYRSNGRSSANRSVRTEDGNIIITKTANLDTAEPGETVSYEVTLTNSGGPIYDAILYDTLYDSLGAVMLDQNWPLYTIDTDETVTINYDVAFATSAPEGTYFNRAQMLGYHKNTNPKYMEMYDSMVATVPINIGEPSPIVLGLATSTECVPYLTSFLKYNQVNDTENVRRLQTFLSEQDSFTAPITGYFDSSTAAAVKTFQQQHAANVLTPWGLTKPTGHVYYTTQKTINEIKCADEKAFPLTIAQTTEIERYKNYSVPTVTTPVPPDAPTPTPAAVSQAVLPKPEPAVALPTIIPNRPLLLNDTFITKTTPTEETASSVRKTLSNLIQIGARTFGQLKFW